MVHCASPVGIYNQISGAVVEWQLISIVSACDMRNFLTFGLCLPSGNNVDATTNCSMNTSIVLQTTQLQAQPCRQWPFCMQLGLCNACPKIPQSTHTSRPKCALHPKP